MENYVKVMSIEALTMLDIARKEIMPAVSKYIGKLSKTAAAAKQVAPDALCVYETSLIKKMSGLLGSLFEKANDLDNALLNAHAESDCATHATYYHENVVPAMQELRAVADELETMVSKEAWPFPTYDDLLFGV